jgi:hypothetical protein
MRRSICYCEPANVKAGTVSTFRFIYTTAQNLPKGTKVRFDLQSLGREVDWQLPTLSAKESTNTIYLELEEGTNVSAKEVEIPNTVIPQFEFTLPKAVNQGESFAITVGAKDEKSVKKGGGNRAQTVSQRRRQFLLYIDPTGKGRFADPEVFTMDIYGNKLENIRILTPSLVGKNKRFDIVVRFEDQYGNLTSDTEDDTLLELSHELLRENLNWKIFVPETGFISLPNLYFNEAGVFTIQLKNLKTKEMWRSSPIRCSEDASHMLLWGLLHGESEKVDAVENIDSALRYFRDDRAHNFYSLSPFEDQKETSNEDWKNCVHATHEFNEDDRFVTFVGCQWVGEPKKEGIRQILYLKDQKQLIRKKDAKGSSLEKLYGSFSEKEMLSIPILTMGKGYSYDFSHFNPAFERVVEIYNAWGSSETSAKKGNLVPIKGSKKGLEESVDGAIIEALNANCRFGFVAGGLDDRGIYSTFYDAEQTQYHPGLTAIIAQEHTKNSLGEALYKRHVYATTGARIVIEFSVAQKMMGEELATGEKPGLLINRHLSIFVAGQDLIETVEVIRNGQVLKRFEPNTHSFETTLDDMDPMEKVALNPKGAKFPFVYYYIRVIQKDGHIAWGSPIWVDITPKVPVKKKVDPKTLKKELAALKEVAVVEEETETFDDLDDEEEID